MSGQLERCGRGKSPKRLRLGLIRALRQVAAVVGLAEICQRSPHRSSPILRAVHRTPSPTNGKQDNKRVDLTSPRPAVEKLPQE